ARASVPGRAAPWPAATPPEIATASTTQPAVVRVIISSLLRHPSIHRLDLQPTEPDRRPLGHPADPPPVGPGIAAGRIRAAVEPDGDRPILADHLLMVPLPERLQRPVAC